MRILIDKGVDINVRDNKGWTPIHLSVGSGEDEEVIKELIQNGADLDVKDEDGRTPLQYAHKFVPHRKNVIKLLKKANKLTKTNKSKQNKRWWKFWE